MGKYSLEVANRYYLPAVLRVSGRIENLYISRQFEKRGLFDCSLSGAGRLNAEEQSH